MLALVEQAQKGDRAAFATLVHRDADNLYVVAHRILRDPHLAQDALHAALLQAWRQLPALRTPERFSAWLLRILVEASVHEAGRQWLAQVRMLPAEPEPPNGPLSSDDRAALDAAFRGLPVEHRVAFVLHRYVGLSPNEIDDILGLTAGLAARRLADATTTMNAALTGGEAAVAYAAASA